MKKHGKSFLMFFIASAILVSALVIAVLNKKAERISFHDDLNKSILFYKKNPDGSIGFYKGNPKVTNLESFSSKLNDRSYNQINEEDFSVSYDQKNIYLSLGKELDVDGTPNLVPESVIVSSDGKDLTVLNFNQIQPQLPDYQTANYQISFAGWDASNSQEIVVVARSFNFEDDNCCENGDHRVSRNLIIAYNFTENKAKVLSDRLSTPIDQVTLYDSSKDVLFFAGFEMPGVQINLKTKESVYNKYGFGKSSKDGVVVSIVGYDLSKNEIYQIYNPNQSKVVIDAKKPSGPKAWGRLDPLYWSISGRYFVGKYETDEKVVYQVYSADGSLRYYKEFNKAEMPYNNFISQSDKYILFTNIHGWIIENLQDPSQSFKIENVDFKPLTWLY